jgi:Cysteine-rich CPCC
VTYHCRCCGYPTLDEEPPGTFAICAVCYWEDDSGDHAGANRVSLAEARASFDAFGACDTADEVSGRQQRP